MPVYRQMDGVDTLDKNTETFENCVYLLERKRPIVIFPEGTHNDKRAIRPIKKGLIRIAFDAEVKNNFTLNVAIVPVGINYSDPYNFGSDVFINIGKPIDVSSYKDIYQKNPAAVINQLRIEIDKAIRNLAIDIKPENIYHEIEMVRKILLNECVNPNKRALSYTFDKTKKLIEKIEQEPDNGWVTAAKEYNNLTHEIGIHDYMLKPGYKLKNAWLYALLFVLLLPVFAVGVVMNYVPFMLPAYISKKVVRDPVFKSSIMFGVALFLFPVYYAIIFSIVGFIFSWITALITIAGGLIGGMLALFYIRKWKKYRAWIKLSTLKKSNDKKLERAWQLRSIITDTFRHVI
jgi:hypothetical protein